jgi:hypothetical protein
MNRDKYMYVHKEILYPIFLECCTYTTNTFWENIFKDLARGKAPYGAYISKGFLCYKHKKSGFSYKIERKEASKMYKEVYNLLTNKLGLLSYEQRQEQQQDFKELEESKKQNYDDWSSIRKKNFKDILIELFVIRMKQKHNLTLKQAKQLMTTVNMALVFQTISTDDIHYTNGEIQRIEGIIFGKGQFKIDPSLYELGTKNKPQPEILRPKMAENWDKFLKELDN